MALDATLQRVQFAHVSPVSLSCLFENVRLFVRFSVLTDNDGHATVMNVELSHSVQNAVITMRHVTGRRPSIHCAAATAAAAGGDNYITGTRLLLRPLPHHILNSLSTR